MVYLYGKNIGKCKLPLCFSLFCRCYATGGERRDGSVFPGLALGFGMLLLVDLG
ncbi:hypothetical protein HMPREF3039_02548 [Akkermansia sp. KLE1798]|nr:hypothetical protein HMPREF3039_02548 [Akkermansia sp. KLE1798]